MNATPRSADFLEAVLGDRQFHLLYLHDVQYHMAVDASARLVEQMPDLTTDLFSQFVFNALRDRLLGKEAEDSKARIETREREARELANARPHPYPLPGHQREDPRDWGLDENWR